MYSTCAAVLRNREFDVFPNSTQSRSQLDIDLVMMVQYLFTCSRAASRDKGLLTLLPQVHSVFSNTNMTTAKDLHDFILLSHPRVRHIQSSEGPAGMHEIETPCSIA